MAIFRKIISKLSGSPFVNIPQWLYELTKIIVPNRFKPEQIKTSKEKKIHVPSLAKTLIGMRNKINSLIAEVNRIPKYETDTEIRLKQIEADIKKLEGVDKQLEGVDKKLKGVDKKLEGVDKTLSVKGHVHPTAWGPSGPSTGRKGGKLQSGGKARTKPVSLTKSQRTKLIDDILNNG